MKKGLLYAIMASVLWAIVNPFIKQGLSYDFTPMNFAGLRFTIVGIILFIYSWHKSMWKEIFEPNIYQHVYGLHSILLGS